jgi:drug/metabolite transporter (DMT)-like permease
MRQARAKAIVALTLVQLFFGIHYFAAKILLQEISPRPWAALRAAAATVVIFAVVLLLRRPLPRAPRDWALLALYSLFGVVINQLCFIEGLSRTTATHSSILITAIPVGTLLFAVLLRRETLTAGRGLALVLSTVGVLLVVRPDPGAPPSPVAPSLVGDVLILVNGLSFAFFLVISKRLFERVDPLAATAVLLLFGSAGVFAVGGPELIALDFATVSRGVWAWAVFIVVFPTATGYMLNSFALRRVESSLVGLFIYLQPVLATGLAVAFLGERLDLTALLGALLIFVGVYLAIAGPGRRRAATP